MELVLPTSDSEENIDDFEKSEKNQESHLDIEDGNPSVGDSVIVSSQISVDVLRREARWLENAITERINVSYENELSFQRCFNESFT